MVVLELYCSNSAYGAIPPPSSELSLSIEEHVKSVLLIVFPPTGSAHVPPLQQGGLNTDENKRAQINHTFKDEAKVRVSGAKSK